MNVFDKPRADPNLFGVCRGEKRYIRMNVFDKPRAESNRVRTMSRRERCMDINNKTHYLVGFIVLRTGLFLILFCDLFC